MHCGIDTLAEQRFAILHCKRVGLVTNHTGVDGQGTRTADLLHQNPHVHLTQLFSPEHGLRGAVDAQVADAVDPRTGVPVASLYGARLKPEPEHLQSLDALVFDIQDAGVRFYTYISTLGLCLQAAAEAGISFIVLDRPNPLGGYAIEGPMAQPHRLSFTAWHPIPVRHGMTVGELARLYNAELHLGADLTVVPCSRWKPHQWFHQTGVTWTGPSPNLETFLQTFLYPGMALLEYTNVSVGRGTRAPFEQVGAPWMDGPRLARHLNRLSIPNVRFLPVRFVPQRPPFFGETCCGVQVVVTRLPDTARRPYSCLRIGLELAAALRDLFPEEWDASGFSHLLANDAAYEAFRGGACYEELAASWRPDEADFRLRREPYLLYTRVGSKGSILERD
ncbi:MAG: exo-beta-N-acetylmuramidase NamZ family protein [Chthonomonadales bacterium]